MKKNIILYAAGGLALVIIIILSVMLVSLYRTNKALQSQAGQVPGRDGRVTDPYLAGPVKNRIIKGYGEIKKCYQDYLAKNPKTREGRVKADWHIDTGGEVERPEIVSSQFQDSAFERCITASISKWRFPEPPVKKYVDHDFTFKDVKKK